MVGSPASSVLRSAPTSGCPSRHGRGRVCRSVSLARRYLPSACSRGLGFDLRSPDRQEGNIQISQVPGESLSACPALRPRWSGDVLVSRDVAVLPSVALKTSAPTITVITGLNHTAYGLAVYASQSRSPVPTQDSLPAGDHDLGRSGFSPAGLQRRFQFNSSHPPSPSFPGAPMRSH